MATKKLERRIQRFCAEYLIDLNAAGAAIRAGYAPRAANVQGCRLLSRRDVQAEIARLKDDRAQRVGVTADDVLRELTHIATAQVPEQPTMSDKLKALDMLARHLGMFTKDNEQKGNQGMHVLAAAILGNVAGAGGVTVPEGGA